MLMVCRDSGPHVGAPLPPLQPVERPAEIPLEYGEKVDWVERGQMPTRAGLRAGLHARVQSCGDRLVSSN